MGKFATVYDLPGGEQMLVCVVHKLGNDPYYQISTEIHGVQTAMEMPCQMDSVSAENKKLTHQAMKDFAVAYLDEMPIENIIELRKMMVTALLGDAPVIDNPGVKENPDAN